MLLSLLGRESEALLDYCPHASSARRVSAFIHYSRKQNGWNENELERKMKKLSFLLIAILALTMLLVGLFHTS